VHGRKWPVLTRRQMAGFEVSTEEWTWSGAGEVIVDTSAPQVAEVRLRAGRVEIEWTEEVDPQSANTKVTIDGAQTGWELLPDRYTLRSILGVSPLAHTVAITPGITDLSGKGSLLPLTVDFAAGAADRLGYRRADPTEIPTSSAANLYGFHGHEVDPATGLVYMRNRWCDPAMGRFVTADPLGYVDGPGTYAFGGNSPFNYSDPLGLYQVDVHFYAVYYLSRVAGFNALEAKLIATASQFVDDSSVGNPLSVENYRSGRTHAIHFAAQKGMTVEEDNLLAQIASREAATSRNLTRIGVAMHTLADSFSHATFRVDHSEQNVRTGAWRPNFGHLDAAHGGQEPDLPFTDVDKAMRMAAAVLRELRLAFMHMTGRPSPTVDEARLRSDLRAAFENGSAQAMLRSAYWKGLIELRFGERSGYDETAPPGFDSAVADHEWSVKSLINLERNPYLIMDIP
ncbi:MAG: RHS repeat-associated core domain-containing protein, partial [Rhodocyclaceae bacterium]|nr:RHS repeat-associated core domain-containing protein [Rhodocyclaceae bacterium]